MESLINDIRTFGGAATRTSLRNIGHSKRSLKLAVDAGELVRVTRSWVALPDTSRRVTTALAAHGRVGGATALESYGVWVETGGETWIALRPGAAYRTLPGADQRFECSFTVDAGRPWRVSLLDALLQYCKKASRNSAVAAIDSALFLGLLSRDELGQLAERLPKRCRPWLRRVNGRAESGLETILRLACEDQGWDVEIQVPFRSGRIDIVINGWLCIEIDGSEFHDVGAQAKKDRIRNTQIVQAGLRWHRFGYADVVHKLDETIAVIRKLLLAGAPSLPAAALA